MAAGDLITENYQVEFNGVVSGDPNSIELVKCGLFSSPDVRLKSLDRPLDHGAFSTAAFYSGRTIELDLEVWGATEAQFQTNLVKALQMTELTDDDEPWVMQVPGFGKVRLDAKCIRRNVSPIDQDYNVGYKAKITSDFWAPNPRILTNTLSSQVLGVAVQSGGLTYDITYDITYGASGTAGNIVTNSGSFETRPSITITGPISNMNLENVTTGKVLSFSGFSLATGQTLVVDFYNRQVLLNGTASRYFWIQDVTQWWTLVPGDNEIRLGGTSAGSPSATVSWRSAWM